MAMDAKMSDGTRALIAFAGGGAADDAARVGVGEVVEENRRLRAMMQALQKGGFGEATITGTEAAQ